MKEPNIEKTDSSIYLLRNDKRAIGDAIASMLDSADEACICVAFLKSSGLNLLKPHIVNCLKRQCNISLFIGTDFYLTEPRALWTLFKLTKNYSNVKFLIMAQKTETFHPKIYLSFNGNKASAIVGSSNLTKGGMADNIEAATLITISKYDKYITELEDYLKSIKKDKRSQLADPLLISQYERRYETFKKSIKKAEREAKSEMAKLFELDIFLLKKCLREYIGNESEQSNWRDRMKSYAKAKKILYKIDSSNISSKSEFLVAYERLVGKKGERGLWHSGSIFRMKNRVASHYKLFLKMLPDLKRNVGATPKKIFEIAKSHFVYIDGLGVNVVTEILNTYAPKRYPILNKNPLSSLKKMGLTSFPNQQSFHPETYEQYTDLMTEIAKLCGFENLSRVDHFMNFIYWKYVKPNEK